MKGAVIIVTLVATSAVVLAASIYSFSDQSEDEAGYISALPERIEESVALSEQISRAMANGIETNRAGFHLMLPVLTAAEYSNPPSSSSGLYSPNGKWAFYPIKLRTPVTFDSFPVYDERVSVPKIFINEMVDLHRVAVGSTWNVVADFDARALAALSRLTQSRPFGTGAIDWFGIRRLPGDPVPEMYAVLVSDGIAYDRFSVTALAQSNPTASIVVAHGLSAAESLAILDKYAE